MRVAHSHQQLWATLSLVEFAGEGVADKATLARERERQSVDLLHNSGDSRIHLNDGEGAPVGASMAYPGPLVIFRGGLHSDIRRL